MRVPLVAKAQVQILSEGVEPATFATELPGYLQPYTRFDAPAIARGLTEHGRFRLRDLPCVSQ
jgi:hypothetical protein